MGDDEGHHRVTRRADLGSEARRWHPGPGSMAGAAGAAAFAVADRPGSDRPGVCSGSGIGWGSVAMIAAHHARPVAGNASRYAAGHVRCGLAATPAAELLSIGSELTVGETRDTNAGEIAR